MRVGNGRNGNVQRRINGKTPGAMPAGRVVPLDGLRPSEAKRLNVLDEMPPAAQAELTQREREVLADFIAAFRSDQIPVIGDLAKDMGISLTRMNQHVESLERKGFLRVKGGVRGRTRQVQLTDKGEARSRMPGIPIYGSIAAGPAMPAEQQEIVTYLESLADVFPRRKPGDFGLKVAGDSMAPEIRLGDYILIRPTTEVMPDDVAVVYVNEDYDATLKRLQFSADKQYVSLIPANPTYQSAMYKADEVIIVGVVRGVVRNYGA